MFLLCFTEPLLSQDAGVGQGLDKKQAPLEIVTEVLVPILVGTIGVGISVAALAISVMSAAQ